MLAGGQAVAGMVSRRQRAAAARAGGVEHEAVDGAVEDAVGVADRATLHAYPVALLVIGLKQLLVVLRSDVRCRRRRVAASGRARHVFVCTAGVAGSEQ